MSFLKRIDKLKIIGIILLIIATLSIGYNIPINYDNVILNSYKQINSLDDFLNKLYSSSNTAESFQDIALNFQLQKILITNQLEIEIKRGELIGDVIKKTTNLLSFFKNDTATNIILSTIMLIESSKYLNMDDVINNINILDMYIKHYYILSINELEFPFNETVLKTLKLYLPMNISSYPKSLEDMNINELFDTYNNLNKIRIKIIKAIEEEKLNIKQKIINKEKDKSRCVLYTIIINSIGILFTTISIKKEIIYKFF